MTKKEIEYILETTRSFSGLEGEVTIVGGSAIMLWFQNARTTEDIDALTKLVSLENFGISTMVNQLEDTFGDYKKDRVSIMVPKNNIESSLKFFVLSKERLFVVKENSGRQKDLEDCRWLEEHADLDMEVVNEIKKEF